MEEHVRPQLYAPFLPGWDVTLFAESDRYRVADHASGSEATAAADWETYATAARASDRGGSAWCPLCRRRVHDGIERHMAQHEFTCASCGAACPSNSWLFAHVQENHDSYFAVLFDAGRAALSCPVDGCGKTFGGVRDVAGKNRAQHLRRAHHLPRAIVDCLAPTTSPVVTALLGSAPADGHATGTLLHTAVTAAAAGGRSAAASVEDDDDDAMMGAARPAAPAVDYGAASAVSTASADRRAHFAFGRRGGAALASHSTAASGRPIGTVEGGSGGRGGAFGGTRGGRGRGGGASSRGGASHALDRPFVAPTPPRSAAAPSPAAPRTVPVLAAATAANAPVAPVAPAILFKPSSVARARKPALATGVTAAAVAGSGMAIGDA